MFVLKNNYIYKKIENNGDYTLSACSNVNKIELSCDNKQLQIGDVCQVEAVVYEADLQNSEDTLIFVPSTNVHSVNFEILGDIIEVPVINGISLLEFSAEAKGKYTIFTRNNSTNNSNMIVEVI